MNRIKLPMISLIIMLTMPVYVMASVADVGQCFKTTAKSFIDFRNKAATFYADGFDADANKGVLEQGLFMKYQDPKQALDPADCVNFQNAICANIKTYKNLQNYWNLSRLPSDVGQCCSLYTNLDPSTLFSGDVTSINQFPQMPICATAYDKSLDYDYSTKYFRFVTFQQSLADNIQDLTQQLPQLAACHLSPSC